MGTVLTLAVKANVQADKAYCPNCHWPMHRCACATPFKKAISMIAAFFSSRNGETPASRQAEILYFRKHSKPAAHPGRVP